MHSDMKSDPAAIRSAAHTTLVANLRNTHALEKQTVTVLEAQLDLLTDYPDMHARVSRHILESREQARRLEGALEACGSSSSFVKDTLLSVMGRGQSSVQGLSDDAVLRALVADMMTEHLEIATYRTLITLAEMAGKPELRPRLEESLNEEIEMAEWLDQNLDAITRRFVEFRALEDPATPEESTLTEDEETGKTVWQTLEEAKKGPLEEHSATDRPGYSSTPDASRARRRDATAEPRRPDPQTEPPAPAGRTGN